MKIFNIQVFGFEAAIRGMRNPRDSQDRSDSSFWWPYMDRLTPWELYDISAPECPRIGHGDLRLMRKLVSQGSSHRKFMRMIQVWCDLELPRYVWTDLDTYKIGTVKNCQSSVFQLGGKLEADDFEDHEIRASQLAYLQELQADYRKSKCAQTMLRIKRNLPESFLQTATYHFSYETALAIYRDRARHILPEFSGPGGICEMISRLPYMRELIE